MDLNKLRLDLADAGCEDGLAGDIVRSYESGQLGDVLKKIKLARCSALDELHEAGRKVDRLDYLIRQTEKENI